MILSAAGAGITMLEAEGPALDLAHIVDQLAGTGFQRLLCEGGPRLHNDLLAAGMLDEVCLTLAPVVVGGHGLRSTSGAALRCQAHSGCITSCTPTMGHCSPATEFSEPSQSGTTTSEEISCAQPTHDAIYNPGTLAIAVEHACGIS